jgi:hypothetical protein
MYVLPAAGLSLWPMPLAPHARYRPGPKDPDGCRRLRAYGVAKAIEAFQAARHEAELKAGQQRWREMAKERRRSSDSSDSEVKRSQEKASASDTPKRTEGGT